MAPQYVDQAVFTFSSQEDAVAVATAGEEDEEDAVRLVPQESVRAARKAYDIVRRSFSARSKSSSTSRRFLGSVG